MTCISKTVFDRLRTLGIITSSVEFSRMVGKSEAYARSVWCKEDVMTTDALFTLFIDMGNLITELNTEPDAAGAVTDLQAKLWTELCSRAHKRLGAS